MKMLINTKEKKSKNFANTSLNSNSIPRQTTAASFYLNPPKSSVKPKDPETVTSLAETVINHATQNIQSSGSSINLASNHMMSCSLSSSSGLVENSSRSSSSIDTGSNTNTDELLNAGNDLIAENSDLSDGSSHRSSINDIAMDAELEQHSQQQQTEYFQKSKSDNLKGKAKKHRQNNYFSRHRRSRIVKTPPIEWSKVNNSSNNEDDQDSGKISDQLDSPKLEKKQVNSKHIIGASQNQELYDYYLKNRNHGVDREDEEMFIKVNASNYSNIESLKLKFGDSPSHRIGKLSANSKPSVTNWLTGTSYSEIEDTHFKQQMWSRSQTQQTSKSFDLGISSPRTQQQDKPVFKYLSKNLINNLFVKESVETSRPPKSIESIGKPLTINTAQEKLHGPPSINYNYLVNKYSPSSRSESYRSQMTKLSSEKKQNNLDTTNKINSSIVSIIKDLVSDVIDESAADQKQHQQQQQKPRYRPGKMHSDELEVAVTVELESDEDLIETDNSALNLPRTRLNNVYGDDNDDDDDVNFLTDDRTFKNTERNRGYLSPRERINAGKLMSDEQVAGVQSKPLIKTLINDITKLKNDTYLTSCLDYLNQNFNKALDDLVELEDTKKATTRGENINLKINFESGERQDDGEDFETIKLSNDLVNISTKYQQINEKQKNSEVEEEDLKMKNNNNLKMSNQNNKLSFNLKNNLTTTSNINASNNICSDQQILLDEEKHNQNNKVDVQVEIEVEEEEEKEESENENEVEKTQFKKHICHTLHEESESERKSDNRKDFSNHVSSMQQLYNNKKNNAKIDESETYKNNNKSCSTKTTNLIITNSNIAFERNLKNIEPIDSNYLNNYAELCVENIAVEDRDSVRATTTKLNEIKEVKDEEKTQESGIDNQNYPIRLENNEGSPIEALDDSGLDNNSNTNTNTEDINEMKKRNRNRNKKVADELVNLQQEHQQQQQVTSVKTTNEDIKTVPPTLVLNKPAESLDSKLASISTHSMEVIEADGEEESITAVVMTENDSSMQLRVEELLKSCSIVSDVIGDEDEIEKDTPQSINKRPEEAVKEVSAYSDSEIDLNVNAALDSLISQLDSINASSMNTHGNEIEDKTDNDHVVVLVETDNNSNENILATNLNNNNIQPENILNKVNKEEEEEGEKDDDEASASKVNSKLDQDVEIILSELVANSESSLKALNDSDNSFKPTSCCTNDDSRNFVDDGEQLANEQVLIAINENSCSTAISSANDLINNEENENSTQSKLGEVQLEENENLYNDEEENKRTEIVKSCKDLLCCVGDDGVVEVEKRETSSNLTYCNNDNLVVGEGKQESTISITTESIVENEVDDTNKLEANNTEAAINSCNKTTPKSTNSDISFSNSLPQELGANILTKDPVVVLDNKCEISDESDELSINKLSAIEKLHTNSDSGDVESHLIKLLSAEEKLNTSNNINTFDDSIDSTNSTQKDQDDSLMASGMDEEEMAAQDDSIRKIVLKNKEIVLVESCSDDDEEDLKRIIRRKNESPAEELFPVLVAQERKAARQRKTATTPATTLPNFSPLDDFLNKKSSTFFPSTASSALNTSTTSKTNTSSNDEDDPFVKAALERFDAFCKSKSSHNLDQTGNSSSSTPATPISPSTPSPSVLQRQKSPFLTRRTITQKSDEPNMKENIGSFIKRRQARIDPNLLRNKSSTPNGSDSESKNPAAGNKPPLMSRSVSETRDYSENPFASNSLRADRANQLKQQQTISSQESSLSSMNSSNLAKRFLGSLTPQLEPMKDSSDAVCVNTTMSSESNQRPSPNAYSPKPTTECLTSETSPKRTSPNSTPTTGASLINRTNSAPSAMPLSNLRANYRLANDQKASVVSEKQNERRASTSSNSSTDDINSPRANSAKPVNHIKLQVVNSKPKTPSPEKQQMNNNSKPPLPPVPVQVATTPTTPTTPTSWRSAKIPPTTDTTGTEESAVKATPTTAVISKPPSQKPGVRMIPLEIKNTKSRVIPLEVKTNGSPSLSRSNSRSENKILSNSFNVTPPVPGKQIEKGGFLSGSSSPEKDEETVEENSGFSNRPRSASSFRIERDGSGPSGASLRTASSFSYRDLTPSLNSNLSTSHSGNLNSNAEHYRQLPTEIKKTADSEIDPADPIVEKACSNFMYKLMEFQRHQKLYSPYSTTTTTTTLPKPELASTISPFTPTSSTYPEPTLKPSLFDYSSRQAPVLNETSISPYTSLYTPSSLQTSLSSQSSLNRYGTTGLSSTYRTDLSKYSSESLTSDPSRPYVSAIRKRRTLFEDLQSTVDNQERLTNQYLIPQENDNVSDSIQQQRPLSIVSEEANGGYHLLTRSLSAKGDSRHSDTSYKSSIDTAMSAYSKISARPPLRKSSSITTPTGGSPYELNSSGTVSPTPSSTTSTSQPKLRSTVFDRLAALNSSNSTKNSLVQKSNSNLNLNLETPEVLKNTKSKVIKDQNEIAVVTNMTPPTTKKDLSQYSSTSSSTTLNRIRSLDSKSREQLKTNKDYANKKTTTQATSVGLASSKLTTSQKNLSETLANSTYSRRLKSVGGVTSHLPPTAPTSTSPTPSNFSSNSNSSFKVDHSTASSTSTTTTTLGRTDVFERLSKRTNSLKNLSSNNNDNKATKTKKLTRTRNSPSSSDHDTDTGKSSPTCSHNEDHHHINQDIETTQNTIANATSNQNSKTSVFERLYKSNIAAHQSLKNQENSNETSNGTNAATSLRKNMSNSTHSLASSNASSLPRKSNWTPRGRSNLARSKAVSNNQRKTEENDASKADDLEDQSTSSSN